MKIAVYSTKQYDKKYLQHVNDTYGFELEFFDFLLTEKTAKTANGCEAVCIFVNDDGSRPVLEELKAHGVKYIALRCAGFNNVDLEAAKELGLRVVRVPAYSPEAVAEHAIGMMMSPTNESTILPKAPPMITPTARSITLPFSANSLNSLIMLMTVLSSGVRSTSDHCCRRT